MIEWPWFVGSLIVVAALTLFISRNFFNFEKKIEHSIHTDYSVNDEVFARTIGQLMGPPLLDGNKVTILQNGDEFFPAMLNSIRSAQHTITFENFLWHESNTAREFAKALVERAQAGVKVHFLQDAFGCRGLRGPSMNLLREAKVDLEIFRFIKLTSLNNRTHRKILIIDGKFGFIGGACIADDWCGDGKTRGLWRDMHYAVEGPAVGQLQQAFMDNWMQTRAELLHGELYFPKLEKAGNERCQVFKSSNSEGADSARIMLLLSIAAAREHVRIANAYFIPDNLCRATIAEACQRGVQVDIIVPGEDIDAQFVRLVGKARWGPLFEAGANIYEYQPARYHCKYLLVDDCWASVGSANLDNRSLRINEEANLNVYDRNFCRRHIEIFEEDKQHSRRVSLEKWRTRPWKEKIKGNIGCLVRAQL